MYKVIQWLLMGLPLMTAGQAKWDGGGSDGQWQNPLNWVGDLLPAEADSVALTNEFYQGSYSVTLPGGVVATLIHSLRVTPAASVTITVILPASNTAAPGFIIGGAGRSLHLGKGSVFINSGGAASGGTVAVPADGFLRIDNGARYIHRTERAHAALVARLSTASGTETGVFEYDIPGASAYTFSTSGRNYGTLILSAVTAATSKTYSSSGVNPLTVRGDLLIQGGATFSYGANTSEILIDGKLELQHGATFNIANGGSDTRLQVKHDLLNNGSILKTGISDSSVIVFNGSTPQTFRQLGVFSNQLVMAVQNPLGVTLEGQLETAAYLRLGAGHLYTSKDHLLTLLPSAKIVNAAAEGFVHGPLRSIGPDTLQFKIGKGEIFAPLTLFPGSPSDTFTVEYLREGAVTASGTSVIQPPLHHVSYAECWRIIANASASARKAALAVTPFSFAQDAATISVAASSGTQWVSHGNSSFLPVPPNGAWITGTVISSTAINHYDYLTIGSSAVETINPLPVRIALFERSATYDDRFNWTVNDGESGSVIALQESADAVTFRNTVSQVVAGNAAVTSGWFSVTRGHGYRWYRLSVQQNGQEVAGSRSIRVTTAFGAADNVSYQNGLLSLKYNSEVPQIVNFIIHSANGQCIFRWSSRMEKGDNQITRWIGTPPRGLYFIQISTPTGGATFKFRVGN